MKKKNTQSSEKGWGTKRGRRYSQILNLPGDENANFRILSLPVIYDHSLATHHTSKGDYGNKTTVVDSFQSQKKTNFNYFLQALYFLKDESKCDLKKKDTN